MANIYVRSTDGSDADNGSTWALAKATLEGALSAAAAGDTVYVSQSHAEVKASTITLTVAGVAGNPVRIIGASDAAEPPTAVSAAPTLQTTANGADFAFSGAAGYYYGLNFIAGAGAGVNQSIRQAAGGNSGAVFGKCSFLLNMTGSGAAVLVGTANNVRGSNVRWENCDVSFGQSAQKITVVSTRYRWDGGSVLAGSASPNALFALISDGEGVDAIVSGVDLSALASTFNLVSFTGQTGRFVVKNCKLPAGWSGSLLHDAPGTACRAEMYNCDSGDTNYRMWVEDYYGSVRSETTIVRTGGASDGATPLAWKMASKASANRFAKPFDSGEIVRWQEAVGSPVTVSVEIVHDAQGSGTAGGFMDDEIWLDVEYMGTSGTTLSSFVGGATTPLATPADIPASGVTWTTTGLAAPVKQTLSATFTPVKKGWVSAAVRLGKPSSTVYVDPVISVT